MKIGIIGGSGLDSADIIQEAYGAHVLDSQRDLEVNSPYGRPSSPVRYMRLDDKEVYLLARHGREHTIPPTFVNYRANIAVLKKLGCECIVATTACGSLRQKIDRGHLVILDQFIDFTRRRKLSFHEYFEPHAPVHTPMADPFDAAVREKLIQGCVDLDLTHHPKGTVVTIEGPRFSTRAESHMFRSWGADVINMSIAPECALAGEAGIPYGGVAMSTDYDCWKEDEAPVTWDEILKIFTDNAEKVTKLLLWFIQNVQPAAD